MKIVAYSSSDPDTPIDRKWIAQVMVPVKQCAKQSRKEGRDGPHAVDKDHEIAGGGKPDRFGFLPVYWKGATEDEAVANAEAGLAERRAKKARDKANALKRAEGRRKALANA